jgi:hypothetical protein
VVRRSADRGQAAPAGARGQGHAFDEAETFLTRAADELWGEREEQLVEEIRLDQPAQ